MENTIIQLFLDSLTEEQRTAVIACKTEKELEQVVDEYDIDLPDEMLADVAGGKGIFQTLVASVIMFTSAGAVIANTSSPLAASADSSVADVIKSGNVVKIGKKVYDISQMDRNGLEEFAQQECIDFGLSALEDYLPYGNIVSPIFSKIFEWTGLTSKDGKAVSGPSLTEINDNIKEMRDEMNKRLTDIETQSDRNTKLILDTIKNENYKNGLGTELTKLHVAVDGIADQISDINSSALSNAEKAIEIAHLIDDNGCVPHTIPREPVA